MIEITIHGRGGQGGVTLAKLIATSFFKRGKHVQAFGVYAAERSGAPLQAYVRIDDEEITNHNQIRQPNHVIVLDRTLIGPKVAAQQDPTGWLILNSPESPASYSTMFPGRRVATLDATSIAVANGLGTRAVPIVNTTMLGAVCRVLELTENDVTAALKESKFSQANIQAATKAYETVRSATLMGTVGTFPKGVPPKGPTSLFDESVGAPPTLATGSWASQRPLRRTLTPPCNHGCPAGNDVRGFLAAAARSDFDEALHRILETSPFPGVCGRVCPAPCMEACNRETFDEPVNIREIERHISDHGVRPEAESPWRDTRVAIVGSGPAGLSAAYHLGRLGYGVTLYESNSELGGVLRTGIPTYRLPRHILDREIDYILDHGVIAHAGKKIQQSELQALSQEYAAVFVATGLANPARMELGDAVAEVIIEGIDFLDHVRTRPIPMNGQHVVVVGGGNTAIDAARSARRLGAVVRIVYRRSREQMPAIPEEIAEAIEEGVALDELLSPLRLRRDGVGALLTCVRMRLGALDEKGRPTPVPETTDDAYVDLRCDRVILALGQSADLSILPEGADIRNGRSLVGLAGSPIFLGGDFATNEGTVAAAIGSGHRAALHIHRTLSGEDLFPAPHEPVASPEVLHMHFFHHAAQREGRMLGLVERKHTFEEVRLGLPADRHGAAAAAEAGRCFSCGVCNQCDRCQQHCPEGILRRCGEGYEFDYDYCKGCGICATQCPRGVIYMAEL